MSVSKMKDNSKQADKTCFSNFQQSDLVMRMHGKEQYLPRDHAEQHIGNSSFHSCCTRTFNEEPENFRYGIVYWNPASFIITFHRACFFQHLQFAPDAHVMNDLIVLIVYKFYIDKRH